MVDYMKIDNYISPIDKLSALSVNQKNCAHSHNICRDGLREILSKLKKDRTKIKKILGFTSRKQAKNRTDKFNKMNKCSMGFKGDRDIFLKFKLIGDQIKKVENELSRFKGVNN